MFLNDIGQPCILQHKSCGPYRQHNGPLLLISAAFVDHVPSAHWCKIIVGSARDVQRYKNTLPCTDESYNYIVLQPKEPMKVKFENTEIMVTLIPAKRNISFYLLNDKCINVLIADFVFGSLDFIANAGIFFHQMLSEGIDIMYIDNLLLDCGQETDKEGFYALVDLIRPKFLYGLRRGKIPKDLIDL
ncbi:CG34008, partial [Drosophila busckii]